MMMKKFVILLACLSLGFQLSGCTAKNSKDDSAVASEFDSSDLEKVEGAEAKEAAASDKSLSSDQLPEDALGETKPTENTAAAPDAGAPADANAPAPAPEQAANGQMPSDPFAASPAPGDAAATPPADASTTVVDATTPAAPTADATAAPSADAAGTTASEPAPAKASAPLQKVASAPWKVGKAWVNTVYFARPGDTLKSISQMIYGADETKQLKKINTALRSRGVKPGDKVYYSSPKRADDSAKLITYYEDNGVAPETYTSQPGDNLRKVSKKLLGFTNAWKEVWATNSVESKDALPEGTTLSYWKGSPAQPPVQTQDLAGGPAAPNAAGTTAEPPAPPQPQADLPAAPPAPNGNAAVPPPPPAQAANDVPPPPPPMPEAQNNVPPPPPPPEMNQAPPPPPPPVEAVNPPAPKPPRANIERETAGTGMDNDTTLALAVVGLAAAGLAILIVVRKKRRQKELEQQAMSETHVGT